MWVEFPLGSVIKRGLLSWRPYRVSLSLGLCSLGACALMASGSGDYLYCNHSACRRRFCSESALAKHYGTFHGRPTCETCGKKLKKSGQVCLISLSLSHLPFERSTLLHSTRALCWIQVPTSKTTPHWTLFLTFRTLNTTVMMPRYASLPNVIL